MLEPFAKSPIFQTIVWPETSHLTVVLLPSNLNASSSTSVIFTFVASDGPKLVTVIVKDTLPVKRKLTQENVMRDLLRLYKANPRENIEKIIKNERPLVKRFIAQAYDGEYSGLPLKVAGIVAQYVEDSI